MANPVTVDTNKCTGCGLCLQACFLGNLKQGSDGKVYATTGPSACFSCGHCVAVCPVQAITNSTLDPLGFEPIDSSTCMDNEQLLALLKMRRSRREFKEDKVAQKVIDKLIAAAVQAPSACNRQNISYTVITDPDILHQLTDRCASGAGQLTRILRHPVGKYIARLYLKDAYQDMVSLLPMIDEIVKAHKSGVDLILHGAPCAILLHAPTSDTFAHDDAVYCSANILLAAETLGLGACLIGFVTDPSRHDPEIKRIAHIPTDHTVHSTIALGYPKFKYSRSVAKLKPVVEYYGDFS